MGLVLGMLLVMVAAWCYPAMAAEGLGWAPEGCRGAIDGLLCFAPLAWSPLPALAWWIAAA